MVKRVTDGSIAFYGCANSKTSQYVLNLDGRKYRRENRFCLKNHEVCDGRKCPDYEGYVKVKMIVKRKIEREKSEVTIIEKKKARYQIEKEKERAKFEKWLVGWEKNIKGEK